MANIRTVAVFCGSNFGRGDAYRDAAAALGRALASAKLRVVYGGTNKGLMGVLADAALDAGGEVHGVITKRLADKGQLHPRLSGSQVVDTMRERKAEMARQADAFIALPGGIGTVEEFVEVWTLAQLESHGKPMGLLNASGFYAPLVAFVDHMIAEAFLPAAHRELVVLEADPARMLQKFAAYKAPEVSKWLT